MTTSHSLSARLDRLTRRERRVLTVGAVASGVILVTALGVLPFAAQWRDRQAAIAAKADQAARLEAILQGQDALARTAETLRDARDARDRSLLRGSTVALAGSALQSLVRRYGEQSRVSLLRLDPARTVEPPEPESELGTVALSVSARGDIYGLVDLLYYLHNGETLLAIDELRVTAPVGLRSDGLLDWTLRVRGFFQPAEPTE